MKKNHDENPVSIFDIGLSARTVHALNRSGITTLRQLRKTTEYHLTRIRNLGVKSIAEINALVPDRIRTYADELEEIAARSKRFKIERAACLLMHVMERDNNTLSQLQARKYRFTGNKLARRVLSDYCAEFPDRISDVLAFLESLGDTSDPLYRRLKAVKSAAYPEGGQQDGGFQS